MNPKRVLLYVQHLLGIGHLKRAFTLARALAGAGMDVTVVSGGFEVPEVEHRQVRVERLPAVSAADLTFKNLTNADGNAIDEAWKQRRREALLAVYDKINPHLLLIELFPFGRRQMRFELLPLLEHARRDASPPIIATSVRDIGGGGQRTMERQEETVSLVERCFDHVLVHGDPKLIAFDTTFPLAHRISHKLHYTGFVVDRDSGLSPDTDAGTNEVLVSAGGGAVGIRLLMTALHARELTRLHNRIWRIIAGVNAPPREVAALASEADRMGDGKVVVERMRTDFATLTRNCAVSVSQAGYNTTMELLDAGTRAVLVPFAGGAETEQTLRANLLARLGLAQVVTEQALTPQALAAAIDKAAATPRPVRGAIDLDGARNSARLVAQWLGAVAA